MKHILFTLVALLLLTACHTQKVVTPPPEPVTIHNTDSVCTEYIETLRIDTVTVFVDIPAQSAMVVTIDTVSILETDFATSRASIRAGTLSHWLYNKVQRLSVNTPVASKDTRSKESAVEIKEIPVPAPYAVEVPRDYSAWEKIKLASYWYVFGLAGLAIFWILKRPLLAVLKKIIR